MKKDYDFELLVNNIEIMVKFYRDFLGCKTSWNGETKAVLDLLNHNLILYSVNDFDINILKNNTSKSLSCVWEVGTMKICSNLNTYDEVDKEYERLIDLGVKSVNPPTTRRWINCSGEQSEQRECIISDPEGNQIEIVAYHL